MDEKEFKKLFDRLKNEMLNLNEELRASLPIYSRMR